MIFWETNMTFKGVLAGFMLLFCRSGKIIFGGRLEKGG